MFLKLNVLLKALIEKSYDAPSLNKIADSLLTDSATIHDLYGANIPQSQLKSSVSGYIPMVQNFIDKYVNAKNATLPSCASNKQVSVKNNKYAKLADVWDGRIDTVCDIEENMWSPWLGITGKVDFTLKVENFLK